MSLAPVDLLRLTMRALYTNPLRSFLTTVGVFMGVSAVMATLQVGSISRAVIAKRLAEREAPQVFLFPRWSPGGAPPVELTPGDMEFLAQRLPALDALSSIAWVGADLTIFQDRDAYPAMLATTEDYLLTTGRQLLRGRFFSTADFASYRPVVVIDEQLVDQLFIDQSPINQQIYINQHPFIIVGVMETTMDDDSPTDGELIMPMPIYHALWGQRRFNQLMLRPQNLDDLEKLGTDAETLLKQRFPGNTFWVWNNVDDILEQRATLQLASRALAAVGAIALVVGGVGIANIMVASTTERITEIGIRRAIGATRQEILVQFILEAVILSIMGGGCAILTVHGVTLVAAQRFDLPYTFDVQTAGLSLSSAIAVGIGASFFPALQASRLNPVEALRSD